MSKVPQWINDEAAAIGGYVDGKKRPRFRFVHSDEVFDLYEGKRIPRYWSARQRMITHYWVYRDGQMRMIIEADVREGEIVTPQTSVIYYTQNCIHLEQWLCPGSWHRCWQSAQVDWDGPLKPKDVLGNPENHDGYFHMYSFKNPDGTPMEPAQYMVDFLKEKWHITLNDPVFKGWDPSEEPPQSAYDKANEIEERKAAEKEEKEFHENFERLMDIFQPFKKHLFHPHPNEGGGKLIVRSQW